MLDPLLETETLAIRDDAAEFERRLDKVLEAVDLHQANLLRYLYRFTQQWQDAEDILQELWKYVLLHFDADKIQSLALLRLKARQLFFDHYRIIRRRREVLTDEVPEVPADSFQEQSFSEASEAGLKEKFLELLPPHQLTPAQLEALWLYARYGFSYEAIGQKLGVGTSTVGDWIALARKRIREYLNALS